jgi:aryl carrier-like protein
VQLIECGADDLDAVGPEPFDLAIINSVAQYFPSGRYLERVIDAALARVRDGGHIFVGDVRNLALLETFHAAVELERSNAGRTTADVKERVRQRVAEESELVIDPRWFMKFQRAHPRIARLKIEPRRGRLHNELTRFRYDVVFEVGSTSETDAPDRTMSWNDLAGLDDLRRRLHSFEDAVVAVRDVPNARLEREVRAVALLNGDACPRTVGELRRELDMAARHGIEPEDVWQLAEEGRYEVHVVAAESGHMDRFDVVLRDTAPASRSVVDCSPRCDETDDDAFRALTNVPFGQSHEDRWTATLRTALQAKLPAHMIPSTFVVLDQMPLTPNGKVDRRALPQPDRRRPALPQTFVTARSPIEKVIAAVWQELLGVEKVGVDDNFFDLGGHSLLLVQLHRLLTARLGVDVSVMDLFRYPTISAFTHFIAQKNSVNPSEDRRSWVSSTIA